MNTLASDYPLAKQLLLLTGTRGDGSALAWANHFSVRLERFKAQPVLQFAVLGFGDRSFLHFCRFAVAVDVALRAKAVVHAAGNLRRRILTRLIPTKTRTPAMNLQVDNSYAPIQIGLHWLIAALVLFQLVFGESMVAATDAAEEGTTLGATDAVLATAHYWVGISVLVLFAVRLAVRLRLGAPAPAEGNALMALAARTTHWLFYILLAVVPVTGLITVHINPGMGEFHQLAKPAFIVLIVIHAGAALFHHFVLRDGTLKRMLIIAKSGRSA